MREFLRRHSLMIGILLMFLLTWPIDLSNAGVLNFKVPFAVYILLGWGFIIAALIMTGLTLGRSGVIVLLKRYLIWRVDWKWYLAAFFLIPGLNFLAIALNAGLTKTPIDFSNVLAREFLPPAPLLLLVIPYFLFDAITNGEEMGWRGYVLPRLQARYSALAASLILGLISAFWHVPKFVTHWNTPVFLWFLVDTTAKAILLTWMYNGTRGSLLLATLFHASFNTAGMMLPMPNSLTNSDIALRGIIGVVEMLAVVIVVLLAGAESLSRTQPKQIVQQDGGGGIGQISTTPGSLPQV
jgi:membrane protease YdiL (CAAX protease family)